MSAHFSHEVLLTGVCYHISHERPPEDPAAGRELATWYVPWSVTYERELGASGGRSLCCGIIDGASKMAQGVFGT